MELVPLRVLVLPKVAGSRLLISAATDPDFVFDQTSCADIVLHSSSPCVLRQAWIQNVW
jgi:hypothetical protein